MSIDPANTANPNNDNDGDNKEDQLENTGIKFLSKMMADIPEEARRISLIILVHGLMGNAKEMGTINRYLHEHVKRSLFTATATSDSENNKKQEEASSEHHFIIHSCTCNENGRTYDGIAAGGNRVAEEINEILRHLNMQDDSSSNNNRHTKRKITLSFVGNSLGGLYSRYALGSIEFTQSNLDVIPKVFVTTATPHLGVKQNTYVKLPRTMEKIVATMMQTTGKDLFCFSSVIEQMTFDPKFVQPLLKFEHRIAFANVHGTDFQVPTATGVFLEESSDSEHYLCNDFHNNDDDDDENSDDNDDTDQSLEEEVESTNDSSNSPALAPSSSFSSFSSASSSESSSESSGSDFKRGHKNIVAVYKTRFNPNAFEDYTDQDAGNINGEEVSLSKQLDAMGWTKVLVDVRPSLKSWNNSTAKNRPTEKALPLKVDGRPSNTSSSTTTSSVASSSDLLEKYGGGRFATIPLGHIVMVANAKDKLNRWITRGGKPVMDSLAKSVIEYLLLSPPSIEKGDDNVIIPQEEKRNEDIHNDFPVLSTLSIDIDY